MLYPLGVPADLKSAVKNVRPIKPQGFVIPQQQQKEKHPAGRLADLRSSRFAIRINIW